MEITLTTPGALEAIGRCVSQLPEMIVGAGTVLHAVDAEEAIDRGAKYIVSPITDVEIIQVCKARGALCMAGASTPNEVFRAWHEGAGVVKVFPSNIGGPAYFRDLKGPFPNIDIMPTGGVTLETGPEFIRCGACAIGVGSALVDPALVREERFTEITSNARALVAAVEAARATV